MKKISFLVIFISFILILLIIFTLSGCKKSKRDDIIFETGTVKYIDIEGGFFGIIGDSGKNYNPINLSEEFQKDNLRVSFDAKIREDMVSFHMWGTLIEIVRIEKLD